LAYKEDGVKCEAEFEFFKSSKRLLGRFVIAQWWRGVSS